MLLRWSHLQSREVTAVSSIWVTRRRKRYFGKSLLPSTHCLLPSAMFQRHMMSTKQYIHVNFLTTSFKGTYISSKLHIATTARLTLYLTSKIPKYLPAMGRNDVTFIWYKSVFSHRDKLFGMNFFKTRQFAVTRDKRRCRKHDSWMPDKQQLNCGKDDPNWRQARCRNINYWRQPLPERPAESS